jgi:hypothetical protein
MPNQLSQRIAALALPANQAAKDQINWLYGALTILDGKANGMLQINSLVMAVIAAFVSYTQSPAFGPGNTRLLHLGLGGCVLAFLLLAASSWRCFQIVRMGWGFLTDLTPGQPIADFTREIEELCGVADARTRCFWWAWQLSRIGFCLIAVLAMIGGLLLFVGSAS